jgi:uncharacterized damage-inducible protein DinB
MRRRRGRLVLVPDAIHALRDHLVRALDWQEAHVPFDKAVEGILAEKRGERPAGFDHSAWQLVEHLRLAQADILDFCVNPAYEHRMTWPDDYWPTQPAPPDERAWTDSIKAFVRSRNELKRLARDVEDLAARVPTGTGNQTYLRSIVLVIDHAAYHVGQLVALRRALGIWKT